LAMAWAKIANQLGVAQQKVANVLQEENLENDVKAMQELGITPIMHDGQLRWPLTISQDMGWQKHLVGNSYNSNSSHALLVGCYTNKVFKHKVYSKMCKYCTMQRKKQNLPHEVTNKMIPLGK